MSQKEREVWQACEDLLAQGRSPQEITGEAIGNRLRELGLKAGSLTYRYRYRDSWMAKQGLSRETRTQAQTQPQQGIIERSTLLFKKSIEDSLRMEFETQLQTQQETIQILEIKTNEQDQALQSSQNQIEKLQAESQQIKQLNRDLRQALQNKQEALIHAEEKAHYADRLYQEKMIENEKFSAELKKTQKENLQMIKKMIEESKWEYANDLKEFQHKYESEQDSWHQERDALKQQISNLEHALDKALLFEQQASEEIKALNTLLEKKEKQLENKEQKRHELEDLFMQERTKFSRVDERLKIALAEIKQLENIV